MAALKTLEAVLTHVKSSNLNFHLQQSPFSAIISIKASFVKDKAGVSLMPNFRLHAPNSTINPETEDKIKYLEEKLENALTELDKAGKDKEVLVNKVEDLNALNQSLQQQNHKLKKQVGDVKLDAEKVIAEKQKLDDIFNQKNEELLQSRKSLQHLKKKCETLELKIESLQYENVDLANKVIEANNRIK